MSIRWARLALVAVSIAALTGCVAGADATPSSPPQASMTAPPMPTPTSDASPEPSPLDSDDPATWIVSGAGIGPLSLGGEFDPAAPAAGPYVVEASECPNPSVAFLKGDGLANVTVVTEEGGSGISIVEVTDWGTSGDVVSPSTAAGVRLGASVADLQAAYPGIEQSGVSNNADVFAVEDAGGWIVIWTMDDVVVKMSSSPTSTVPSELCG